MASKNEHTGDLIMTKRSNQKLYEENYEKIFGKKKKAKRGRYEWHPEKQTWVPASEMPAKSCDARSTKFYAPTFHVFRPYESPVTGELIESASQERNHLKQHNCRIYEGFEQEQRVADAHKAELESKFEAKMLDAIDKTAAGLKYHMVEKADPSKPLNIFNDD
jgi:hypothetical protein